MEHYLKYTNERLIHQIVIIINSYDRNPCSDQNKTKQKAPSAHRQIRNNLQDILVSGKSKVQDRVYDVLFFYVKNEYRIHGGTHMHYLQ